MTEWENNVYASQMLNVNVDWFLSLCLWPNMTWFPNEVRNNIVSDLPYKHMKVANVPAPLLLLI